MTAQDTSTNSPSTGGSFRVAWTADDASGSLHKLFKDGAVVQPLLNGTVHGSPVAAWLVGPDGTRASGEATLPLAFEGPASVDLALLTVPLAAPILGKALNSSQVLARLQEPLQVEVAPFVAPAALPAGGPAVTMWWEPWFTPLNFGRWPLGEAQPSLGTYESSQPLSARQHALWLASASVTRVGVDWTNNLWGCDTFACRHPNARELINATQLAAGVWQGMRAAEGVPAPASLLLTGLDNGPSASMQALQEQAAFAATALLNNASAGGANSSVHDPVTGDPLLVAFDGRLVDHRAVTSIAGWSVRWMGSQLQSRPSAATSLGYWSWMDGTEAAVITPPAHKAADTVSGAVTVSSAFFAQAGWTGDGALGKRGGATLVESVLLVANRTGWLPDGGGMALQFLFVNQWNEFAGQANGGGYGPNKTDFVDIYSAELGNDMEPTDLRACGYKRWGVACGGYGWRQLNLLRWAARWAADPAGTASNDTMLFVAWPPVGWAVNGSSSVELRVLWARFDADGHAVAGGPGTAAPPASALSVSEVFAHSPGERSPLPVLGSGSPAPAAGGPPQGTSLTVPAPHACSVDSRGLAVLRICAADTVSRWPLSLREDDGAQAGTSGPSQACVEHAIACSL